ncbi:MAG: carboxylating nicotinate-nucleotide diphosphorylase [Thermoplasmata archaeon]
MSRRRRPAVGIAGLDNLVARALEEDRWRNDRTTSRLLPSAVPSEGRVRAQASGRLSGIAAGRAAARRAGLRVLRSARDGDRVRPGATVLVLRGDGRAMLAIERTILNFLMHASGIATATDRAVRAARGRGGGPGIEIWATRKTLPGLRDLEKAAVVHGGGRPHRRDLSDAVLLKNNHLAFRPLAEAIARGRRTASRGETIQVEVRSRAEAIGAFRAGARSFLIDNVGPSEVRAIVRELRSHRARVWIEVSGGITPETVGRYRRTGVDAASLGALTHSAAALPFHMQIRPLPALRPASPRPRGSRGQGGPPCR